MGIFGKYSKERVRISLACNRCYPALFNKMKRFNSASSSPISAKKNKNKNKNPRELQCFLTVPEGEEEVQITRRVIRVRQGGKPGW